MPIAAGITSVGTAGAQSLGTPGGTATVQAGAPGTISKVDWLTDRRVAVWVNSPSMGVPIQVQLLLARDWNAKPDAKFPAVYMLDGMRARDDENGWTLETDAEAFYADKNVNVVMPIAASPASTPTGSTRTTATTTSGRRSSPRNFRRSSRTSGAPRRRVASSVCRWAARPR